MVDSDRVVSKCCPEDRIVLHWQQADSSDSLNRMKQSLKQNSSHRQPDLVKLKGICFLDEEGMTRKKHSKLRPEVLVRYYSKMEEFIEFFINCSEGRWFGY